MTEELRSLVIAEMRAQIAAQSARIEYLIACQSYVSGVNADPEARAWSAAEKALEDAREAVIACCRRTLGGE